MTATWLNGKGSRWTVMGEHLKQVHLRTTVDDEKSCSVSQPKKKNVPHSFSGQQIIEWYLLNLFVYFVFLSFETYKPGALCFL